MIKGIRCPQCGSEEVAEALYGMPVFDEDLQKKLDAGDVVLMGCEIIVGEKNYPYICKECGHRFDEEMAKARTAKE